MCCPRSLLLPFRIHPPPFCCQNRTSVYTTSSWRPQARTRAPITASVEFQDASSGAAPPRPPYSMTIGIYHCTAEAAAARDSCSQGWTSGRRLAQPVCWEPRSRRDHAALVRKAVMSIRGLPSTHWASLGNCGRQQCLRLALFSHSPFSNRNFA